MSCVPRRAHYSFHLSIVLPQWPNPTYLPSLRRGHGTADRLERKRGGTLLVHLGRELLSPTPLPSWLHWRAKLGVLCSNTSSVATKYCLGAGAETAGWLCCSCHREDEGARAVLLLGQGLAGGGTLTPCALSLQHRAPGGGPWLFKVGKFTLAYTSGGSWVSSAQGTARGSREHNAAQTRRELGSPGALPMFLFS